MKKNLLKSMLVALMVMVSGSAWAGDKTVVKYSFDDASSPEVTAGNRVSLDYTRTSVITSTKFLNAWNNTNGDPASSTISLGSTDLSAETWTLSFEWAAVGGCNSKADHTTLKAGDTNLFDLSGNSNWNTTVTLSVAGAATGTTLPVPGCDKNKRFTANTGDQMNTTAYWHHIVVTGSSDGVKLTITNSSTGTAIVTDMVLSETNVNPTGLVIEPCCGGAIGIDELSLTYYVAGEVIQTPMAAYTKVDGINRTITATCDTEGATLYYSLDNENWTEGASVTVSTSGNVYFKAVKGSSESDVLTFAAEAGVEIVLNAPVIVRNANGTVTISADQSKLLLSPTATIYYTYGEENGSFTGSKELTVAADATITAYAEADGYAKSADATRAVALFPENASSLFSAAAATNGWSANAFSDTITASERTYATLLLDGAAWSESILFQTNGAWGLRASGNWYINSNTANSWILVKDTKAGNIVVVDATFAPAEAVNATYAEKYSFGTKHAYTIDADGNAEFALIKPSANEMDYLYGFDGYSLIKKEEIITPAYGTIWENGETTTDENENTNAEIAAAYFNNFAKANDTIRATVVVAAPARAAGPARIIATGNLSVFAGMNPIYEAANIPVGESKLDIALDNEDLAAIAEAGSLKFVYNNLTLKKVELVEGAVDPAAIAAAKEALQTAIAIASNINPEGLAEAIAAAQAVLTNEDATLQQIIQATQALETAIKSYFEAVLPRLGAIVGGLNDSTLNAAYADAQAALAKEDVTPQELAAAMQKIIVVAQAVAPEHLNNLKGYAVKYGAEQAVALVDSALVAINEGNVAKIIATMAAVKEAATPLAKQVLGGIIEYVKAFGLTEQAAQAQAALESDNYVTMITVAKALFNHLIAAAKDYLPKLAIIAEGLNDSTLNVAYAEADTLLAKESITPEELGAAMQKIIVAAKAVAPAHLQNLRAYALKYGQEGTAALVDSALVAINEGNVSKIIATMTAVREAATPLATNILTQLVGYAQNYDGFEEDVTEAQAVLRGGNYITMITTAKALYAKLIAAAKAYVTKVKAIPTEGKEGVEDLNTAINAAELALAAEDSDFSAINTAITNLIAAVKAFTKVNEIAANEALVAGASLENPVAAPFVVNGTFDEDTNGWTSTGEFQNRGTATNQAGAFTGKFWENWNPDPKANKMYQIAECIPNGIYKLNIAAFVNTLATPNESQYVYANNDKEFLTTGEPTMYEVYTKVENNTMEFGLEQTTATANWMGIDNISLTYYGTECTIEQVKAAAFYAEIDAALAAKQSVKTKNALETAYEAYKAEANDEKLNTLKEALANAKASINSYKILETGIIPDNSLEGWTCTNTNTFHINTWSGEGNSDGSNMTTPFIENWVYRDNVLGTGEIYYTLPGLDPGIYSFTALIRAYSESGNAPTGASLFAQDREKEFATGKSFEYNNMKGIYDNYAMSAEVGEDGVFRFGIKISAEANFNWMAFKNCRVAYVGAAIDEAAVNGLAATMPEGKMNAEIKTAADNAIATLRQEINLDNYEAAQKAIAAAKASIEAYAKMKSVLDFIAEEVAKTNMYTAAAKATFDESIATAQKGYDEGTMGDADAAAFNYGSRLEGLLPTLLLSAYTSDVEGTPYINTWSVEGDNDGSEFKVPFYEYWTGDGNSLAANTITATLTGLEAGNYEVKAWVRVRMKNGAEAPAGITMSVNDETAVDVCAGDQIGTSPLYAKEFTAVGDVFAGDDLKFKFNIAADNTISWLSFKNVKYTRLSETVGITNVKSENKLDGTVYNLNGQKVEKAQRGLYIVNGKKVVVK
ncbi:hypothetical protein [Prevotella sp. E13-27]|uniref:hypothetical protein n=1 Tax=Prevotella sp. E13-27 TaxID=2938122 RepID=UPI00200B4312|nr:hypothetical protein [Prevotella sp. E13-27]MCK8621884.1 hypothetical protein [Prevotella sp. E13-27]